MLLRRIVMKNDLTWQQLLFAFTLTWLMVTHSWSLTAPFTGLMPSDPCRRCWEGAIDPRRSVPGHPHTVPIVPVQCRAEVAEVEVWLAMAVLCSPSTHVGTIRTCQCTALLTSISPLIPLQFPLSLFFPAYPANVHVLNGSECGGPFWFSLFQQQDPTMTTLVIPYTLFNVPPGHVKSSWKHLCISLNQQESKRDRQP